jgi:hypothetical protein
MIEVNHTERNNTTCPIHSVVGTVLTSYRKKGHTVTLKGVHTNIYTNIHAYVHLIVTVSTHILAYKSI